VSPKLINTEAMIIIEPPRQTPHSTMSPSILFSTMNLVDSTKEAILSWLVMVYGLAAEIMLRSWSVKSISP
jgi:hypothetical protein